MHGEANGKYMKNYDSRKLSKYIMYLDANNLYGCAMGQYLPTGGFKWMSKEKMEKTNLGAHTKNSKMGLILEVDLEYPNKLHKKHNDYPLVAEKTKVSKEKLSNYCEQVSEKYGIIIGQV